MRWTGRPLHPIAGLDVYTAEPGTEDAERLALAVVLCTQSLVD
jgi:hypothetical protein